MMTPPTVDITRESDTASVAEWCRGRHLPAVIVGRWVWVEFSEKPHEQIRADLKAAGFRWNQRRAVWMHACNYRTRTSHAGTTVILAKYGAAPIYVDAD